MVLLQLEELRIFNGTIWFAILHILFTMLTFFSFSLSGFWDGDINLLPKQEKQGSSLNLYRIGRVHMNDIDCMISFLWQLLC